MKRFVPVVIVAFSILASAQAPVATGGITGSVKDGSGAPLRGVTVTAYGSGGTVSVLTSEQGVFTLANLATGGHFLRVTLPGFREHVRDVIVASAQTVQMDVTLHVGPLDDVIIHQMVPSPPFRRQAPYTIAADSQTQQGELVRYRGNVRVTTDSMELTADELEFNARTLEGEARGDMRVRVLPVVPRLVPLSRR